MLDKLVHHLSSVCSMAFCSRVTHVRKSSHALLQMSAPLARGISERASRSNFAWKFNVPDGSVTHWSTFCLARKTWRVLDRGSSKHSDVYRDSCLLYANSRISWDAWVSKSLSLYFGFQHMHQNHVWYIFKTITFKFFLRYREKGPRSLALRLSLD